MQKVLRQTLLRRNQVLKNERRKDLKKFKEELRDTFQQRILRTKELRANVKAERHDRREDWILGPLAPNRNVGAKRGAYGALTGSAVRQPTVVERDREKYINFAAGDRVVVVRGKQRGKIAKIKEIDETRNSVELEGLNIADVEIPEFAQKQGQGKPFTAYTIPIPLNDVRLVIPMEDDETGEIKDVVVRHLRGGEPIVEREYGTSTPKHTRYIAGLDEEIPWPSSEVPEYQAEECDTLRLTVEEKTYIPTYFSPMPESVINELRNPYDRQRTLHETKHVEAKALKDLQEGWKKRRRMLTPQTQYWEMKAKEKARAGPPEVSSETLQLIKQMRSVALKETT